MSYLPVDLAAFAETHDGISTVRATGHVRDWNNIHYRVGLSARNVGAKQLSMNVATIPPGGVARAHVHVGFEVMLYIVSGRVRHEFGDHLKLSLERGHQRFDAIWFGHDQSLPERIQAAYRLEQNVWNGMVSVQLVIEHAG